VSVAGLPHPLTRLSERRPAFVERRLAASGALMALAVVVRGLAGVLLGIFAAMVLLDAVIPMPGGTRTEADDAFRHLVLQRRRARRARRLRRLPPEALDVLDDASGWAAAAEHRNLGVRSIPLHAVTGTVEDLKARTFDRAFRPDASGREHWRRIWLAHASGASLPPVSVYRVGDEYAVRDGHHRVSVALAHGDETIDADVVELVR
jgi:hypothetical protein